MSVFSESLKFYREKAGYSTSTAFAKAVGFNLSMYSRYESGISEPGLSKLVIICQKLNVSFEDLIGVSILKTDVHVSEEIRIMTLIDKIKKDAYNAGFRAGRDSK